MFGFIMLGGGPMPGGSPGIPRGGPAMPGGGPIPGGGPLNIIPGGGPVLGVNIGLGPSRPIGGGPLGI